MLGDGFIAQHISQAYREHMEQVGYKAYMSDMARNLVSMLSGNEIPVRWVDTLAEFAPAPKKTETEQQIKSRIMAKLNGKEG